MVWIWQHDGEGTIRGPGCVGFWGLQKKKNSQFGLNVIKAIEALWEKSNMFLFVLLDYTFRCCLRDTDWRGLELCKDSVEQEDAEDSLDQRIEPGDVKLAH